MSQTVTRIKEKLDIVEFLKGYITLKPAGKNFKANCPFHKEKTPSFIVSPDRQTWHCFGCNIGGDAFAFIMQYENIEFFEALKLLSEKTGVPMEREWNAEPNARLYDVNEAAKKFFISYLADAGEYSTRVRGYLKERGLIDATIAEFELGAAPVESDILSRHLGKLGFRMEDIERAGLIAKSEQGTYWDRFRKRIMFPIHNHFGRVVGFTGRIVPWFDGEGIGKYVNTPETSLFIKSRILYGLYRTKSAIRETHTAVLVEGQMDFLLAYQDGVANVVASSGTAFTAEHLKVLERIADTLVIAFDADDAGRLALERTADMAASLGFITRVLSYDTMGEAKDPADIAHVSPGKLAPAIAAAIPTMEYYLLRYWHRGDMQERKRALTILLRKLGAITSAMERSHWLQEVALRTGIKESDLTAELRRLDVQRNISTAIPVVLSREVPRAERIAERLLAFGTGFPRIAENLKSSRLLFPAAYQAHAIFGGTGIAPEYEQEILRASLTLPPEEAAQGEYDRLLVELRVAHWRSEQERLREAIYLSEKTGDTSRVQELLKQFDEASRSMHNR